VITARKPDRGYLDGSRPLASSSGRGRRPLTTKTGVRFRLPICCPRPSVMAGYRLFRHSRACFNRPMRTTGHVAALAGLLLAALPAHAFNTKAGSDVAGSSDPVTPEEIKSRGEEQAQKLQYSLPRHFTFSGAPPRDRKELTALANYMVYLFVVWTQKAEELPVKRIFIRAPRGEEIPVPNVSSWRAPVDQGSPTAKRFGPYRQDGFYLVPTGAMVGEGQLILALTAGQTEWPLVDFPSSVAVSRQGKFLSGDPAPGAKPNLEFLQNFVRREFPGFPVPKSMQ
jgi:hypothetical protein